MLDKFMKNLVLLIVLMLFTCGCPKAIEMNEVIVQVPESSKIGETFMAAVVAKPVDKIAGMQADLHFNPAMLEAQAVYWGDFIVAGEYFQAGEIDNENGTITGFAVAHLGAGEYVDTEGIFLSVEFLVLQNGESHITLDNVILGSMEGKALPVVVHNGG